MYLFKYTIKSKQTRILKKLKFKKELQEGLQHWRVL